MRGLLGVMLVCTTAGTLFAQDPPATKLDVESSTRKGSPAELQASATRVAFLGLSSPLKFEVRIDGEQWLPRGSTEASSSELCNTTVEQVIEKLKSEPELIGHFHPKDWLESGSYHYSLEVLHEKTGEVSIAVRPVTELPVDRPAEKILWSWRQGSWDEDGTAPARECFEDECVEHALQLGVNPPFQFRDKLDACPVTSYRINFLRDPLNSIFPKAYWENVTESIPGGDSATTTTWVRIRVFDDFARLDRTVIDRTTDLPIVWASADIDFDAARQITSVISKERRYSWSTKPSASLATQ